MSEETVDRDSDNGRSPKVPPLRIKLGNNTPPPSQSHPLSSLPLELAQSESCAPNSGDTTKEPTLGGERKQSFDDDTLTAAPQLKQKSETPSEFAVKEEGDGQGGNEVPKVEQEEVGLAVAADDEEKKSADAASTLTPHQTKRGVGGGGKVVKVTSSSDSASLKRHAAPESGDAKIKDMSEVFWTFRLLYFSPLNLYFFPLFINVFVILETPLPCHFYVQTLPNLLSFVAFKFEDHMLITAVTRVYY